MKNFFTSDFHLSHANIIKYDNRPFQNTYEMDKYIIDTVNSHVGLRDNLYFLGDFCFDRRKTEMFLAQLNGNLFL